MSKGLPKSFISISDLYVAYRKAKSEAFFERTHSNALIFSEYEQDIEHNLQCLYDELTSSNCSWYTDLGFVGSHGYLPKSVNCSGWDHSAVGHFQALDPFEHWEKRFKDASAKPAKADFRLVIYPTVNFQIISALWIIKVGHLFDEILDPDLSYGHRLRRRKTDEDLASNKTISSINLSSIGLFEPYFSGYRNWRDGGLEAIENSLREGKSTIAITMDVERFYHRVSPKFLLRNSFLEDAGIDLTNHQRRFTQYFLRAIENWYAASDDYPDRTDGAIPVGISASKIIANVLLAGFDRKIKTKLKPIYYGRYVDDIFLVFENTSNLSGSVEVMRELSKRLTPELKVAKDQSLDGEPGSTLSLRLHLPYADDSLIRFSGRKQKIFALKSDHGLDLIAHIKAQIKEQSSEHRLLPVIPEDGSDMASKALLVTPDATLQADALRKADSVSVKRLGMSLLMRDLEYYGSDLAADSWKKLRKEFYGLVRRHLVTPEGFFEYHSFLPRVFGLMVACRDIPEAHEYLDQFRSLIQLINKTTTAGSADTVKKFKKCRADFARSFLQQMLQSCEGKPIGSRLLNLLEDISSLDKKLKVPKTVGELRQVSRTLLLSDWSRRPYKEYWYRDQEKDEDSMPAPSGLGIQRRIRLGAIRKFRERYTELRVPHWPAVAFPTRPLTFDEIALIGPDVLNNPAALKQALMGFRGARVRPTTHEFGFVPNQEEPQKVSHFYEGAAPKTKKRIKIAVTSYQTTLAQFESAAVGSPDRSYARFVNLNKLINAIIAEPHYKPHYVVFPELSLPRRWAFRIARKLSQHQISLIAGLEYQRDRTSNKLRNDCLLALSTDWPGYATYVGIRQPKMQPSHFEREKLPKLLGTRRFAHPPSGIFKKPIVYIHKGFCFSALICSDLTNIENRSALRGQIDALFGPEWNKDLKTFSAIVESSANDLHAFIVQVNNRMYGDSRIRVPAKEEFHRDVVQVKGGETDYYVIGEIDYNALRTAQRSSSKPKLFKPLPIGYNMSKYRRNGK